MTSLYRRAQNRKYTGLYHQRHKDDPVYKAMKAARAAAYYAANRDSILTRKRLARLRRGARALG
jgi:hypothetical protein